MSEHRFVTDRYPQSLVFLRGWAFGGISGALAGGVVGTIMVPIFGTIVGFVEGGIFGFAIGLPCAVTLLLVVPRLTGPVAVGWAGAVIGSVWSLAAIRVFEFDVLMAGLFGPPQVWLIGGVLLSALIGARVAPRATFRRAAVAMQAEDALLGTAAS